MMWLRRAAFITDLHHLFTFKVIPKCNFISNASKYQLNSFCFGCRYLSSTSSYLQQGSRYVYDHKSDSFVPRGQISKQNLNKDEYNGNNDPGNNKGSIGSFLKRFCRNLFFLTGGIVWCAVVLISIFGDAEESTGFVLSLEDSEEAARLFGFYDVVQSETDLANLLSDDKEFDVGGEIEAKARKKEAALHNALNQIKKQNIIVETLGEPVQFSGYRAASKLSRLSKNFQNLKKFGMGQVISGEDSKCMWTAECLLEGPNGLASLHLEFETPLEENEWVLSNVIVESLQKSDHLLQLSGSLPEGVKFTN